jgi:8-oxo-dGTP pyrophosphatase MutT (NUDIX family)
MGGGILPVAKHNGEIYLLFSRERLVHSRDRDRGKWSDFGGSREGKETQYHTAVREGVEESSGILGDKKDVRNLIRHHLMGKIRDKAYSIWLVEVDYNPDIISVFRNHFKDALKNNLETVKKHNGLFEKDKLQWIKLSTLDRKKYMFRPWYKRFIPQIIEVLK